MTTREACKAELLAEVLKYAALLGVDTSWRWEAELGTVEDNKSLDGNSAIASMSYVHHLAKVTVNERVLPKYYPLEAAHEVQHVFFAPLERAIESLGEPAKTVLDDHLHWCIARLAEALTGLTTPNTEKEILGKVPPWETPSE